MGTSATQDDPLLRLKYYESTGQTDEAAKYKQYLSETGQLPSESPVGGRLHQAAQQPGGLKRLKLNIADQNAADRPSPMANVQGAVDAFAQEVPFVERGLTLARAKVQGEPYGKALAELRT